MKLTGYEMAFDSYIKELEMWAQQQMVDCKRKIVACGIVTLVHKDDDPALLAQSKNAVEPGPFVEMVRCTNGPTPGHECTGEVGNCGCAHAEPLAVLALMNMLNRSHEFILCCNYSPCTRCAHVIINAHQVAGLISAVVFKHLTEHDVRGAELLVKSGITVEWLDAPPRMCVKCHNQYYHNHKCPMGGGHIMALDWRDRK